MKDWKAAYEQAKGEIVELKRDRDYYRSIVENQRRQDEQVRDKFKELLIDVLGRG